MQALGAVMAGLASETTFSEALSWTIFGWLLAAELLVLFGGTWLHRRQLRNSATSPSAH